MRKGLKKFKYSCVNAPNVPLLHYIIDNSRQITYNTFRNNVNMDDLNMLKEELGYVKHYKQGLTFTQDWHISFHKSKTPKGRSVYFFTWSAIEHIFM